MQSSDHGLRVLRSVVFRVSAASPAELLSVIPSAAQSLQDCKSLLKDVPADVKQGPAGAALHKLKVRVGALLKGKAPEERWAGVLLANALVGLGGYQMLQQSANGWTQSILTNLNKDDGPSLKTLEMIALLRIFEGTRGYPELVRDVTTPALPTFIKHCLASISNDVKTPLDGAQLYTRSKLLPTIFSIFSELIKSHPNVFRPFLSQFNRLIAPLLAPTADAEPEALRKEARRLFTLLHFSSPKSTSTSPSIAYTLALKQLLQVTHATLDHSFRSLVEEWLPIPESSYIKEAVSVESECSGQDSVLNVPAWTGVQQGCQRIEGLLRTVEEFLYSESSGTIEFPIADIVDLLLRVCGTVIPATQEHKNSKQTDAASVRINDQISQEERDRLFAELPGLHKVAIECMGSICARFGQGIKSLHAMFLDQIVWVFDREGALPSLRIACYDTLAAILGLSAGGFDKATIRQTIKILQACCNDLVSPESQSLQNSTSADQLTAESMKQASKNAAGPMAAPPPQPIKPLTPTEEAASRLLVAALGSIPSQHLPPSVRSTLDRTAVLTQDAQAMIASVVNAPKPSTSSSRVPSSILPFLARAHADKLEVQGLLFPRLPVIRMDPGVPVQADGQGEDSETESEQDDVQEDVVDSSSPSAEEEEHVPQTNGHVELPSRAADPLPIDKIDSEPQPIPQKPASPSRKRVADDYQGFEAKRTKVAIEESKDQTVVMSETSNNEHPGQLPLEETMATMPRASPNPFSQGLTEEKSGGQYSLPDPAEDSDDSFYIPELTLEADTEDEEDEDVAEASASRDA